MAAIRLEAVVVKQPVRDQFVGGINDVEDLVGVVRLRGCEDDDFVVAAGMFEKSLQSRSQVDADLRQTSLHQSCRHLPA